MGLGHLVDQQFELMAELWEKEHPGQPLTESERQALMTRARMIVEDIHGAQQAESRSLWDRDDTEESAD